MSWLSGVGTAGANALDRLRCDWDVSFGTDPRQGLDIVRLHGVSGRPCLVYWHGGGFVVGDKSNVRDQGISGFAPVTLARAGFVVFIPNYRLSRFTGDPLNQFPEPEQDCAAAISWIRVNAPAYGGDPDRIVLAGGSAGASYDLYIGSHTAPQPWVKGVISNSPGTVYCLTDPRILTPVPEDPADYIARLSIHELEVLFHLGQTSPDGSYLNCALYPESMEAAQPVSSIVQEQPPSHLTVSMDENMPFTIVVRYAKECDDKGAPYTLDLNGVMDAAALEFVDNEMEMAGKYRNVNPTLGTGDIGGAGSHADYFGEMDRMIDFALGDAAEVLELFGDGAYWTQPCNTAPVDAASATLINYIKTGQPANGPLLQGATTSGSWGRAVYHVSLLDPEYAVVKDGGGPALPAEFSSLRFPSTVGIPGGTDKELTIIDIFKGYIAHVWQAAFVSGVWHAAGGSITYIEGSGIENGAVGGETRNTGTFRGMHPVGYVDTDRIAKIAGPVLPVLDASGNAKDFSRVGAPVFGTPGLLTGDADTACQFANNGSTRLQRAYDADLGEGMTTWTIGCWVKLATLTPGVQQQVMDMRLGGAGWEMQYSTSGNWIGTYGDGTNAQIISTATAAVAGQTRFLVMTHNGTQAQIYLDGVLKATSVHPYAPSTTEVVKIGHFFGGVIDEVMMIPTAISGATIANLYTAGTGGGGYSAAVLALNPLVYLRLGDPVSAPGGYLGHVTRMFVNPGCKPGEFLHPMTGTDGSVVGSPIIEGMRIRLKNSFVVATYPPPLQVILRNLKAYGAICSDQGGNTSLEARVPHVEGGVNRWASWEIDEFSLSTIGWDNFEFVERTWTP